MAMIIPKIAITIRRARKTIAKNKNRTRELIYLAAISEILLPSFRIDIINAPKSWTAPIKILPRNTHKIAGNHPQIIPMAGPTIGPVPAIEVK
jgi:hypothetical protein